MVIRALNKYFVFNDEIRPAELFVPAENEGGIYEVLRVSRGVPLFLEDHFDRFFYSAELAKKKIKFSKIELELFLKELIKMNDVTEGNVLVSCKVNLKMFFIPHLYPNEKMYQDGVKCGLLKAERDNPNAKVFQTSVRKKANQLIDKNGFYEVILVDHFGHITEGSRSNVFFVQDEALITPPSNAVLKGITRLKVLQLASEMDLNIIEKDISLEDLTAFQSAFITGTSPKILPINQLDKQIFNPQNRIVLSLIRSYNELIDEYINESLSN